MPFFKVSVVACLSPCGTVTVGLPASMLLRRRVSSPSVGLSLAGMWCAPYASLRGSGGCTPQYPRLGPELYLGWEK